MVDIFFDLDILFSKLANFLFREPPEPPSKAEMLIEKIKNESVRVQKNMERIRKSKIEIMELEYAMEKLKEDNRKKENDTIEHINQIQNETAQVISAINHLKDQIESLRIKKEKAASKYLCYQISIR